MITAYSRGHSATLRRSLSQNNAPHTPEDQGEMRAAEADEGGAYIDGALARGQKSAGFYFFITVSSPYNNCILV